MSHADIDPMSPPRRRIGAVVIVRDPQGRVLLVLPNYDSKPWQLPGGGVHEGESIAAGAARELEEETGLVRQINHYLALDQMPANDKAAEGFNIVCNGGILTADEAEAVSIPAHAAKELQRCKWVHPGNLPDHVAPYQERRILAALNAIDGALPLLVRGEPVSA